MAGQLLLACLFAGVFLFFSGKQLSLQNPRSFTLLAALLFFSAFVVRIFLGLGAQGFETDMNTFKSWARMANNAGFSNIYRQDIFIDYPPGYIYVLVGLEKLRLLLNLPSENAAFTLLMKLPSIGGDFFCAGALLYLGAKRKDPAAALFLAGAYLFCPAVLVNSAVWGQADSFCLSILLASLLCLYQERYFPAAILFGLSILCKPQMLIFTPLFLFFAIRRKKWKQLLLCPPAALGVMLLTALPFTQNFDFLWLADTYKTSMDGYPYFTVNAYNFWALIGKNWGALPAQEQLSNILLHWAGPILATAWCGWLMLRAKQKSALFGGGIVLITAVYLATIKMHERYLFPVVLLILLACMFCEDRRLRIAFAAVSLVHFLNVAYVLNLFHTVGNHYDPNEAMVKLISGLQILACGYLLYVVTKIYAFGEIKAPVRPALNKPRQVNFQTAANNRLRSADFLLAAGIAVLYALVAFWHLGSHETATTSWTPGAGESVVVRAQREGCSLTFLPGIAPEKTGNGASTGSNVKLEISNDGESWEAVEPLKDSAVFAWSRQDLGAFTSYLRLTALDSRVCLNEIALTTGVNGEILPLSLVDGAGENLIDEQEVVPVTITSFNSMYFDEIYHARTAYETLLHLEPYENTHPPLGKLIIGLGIRLFGMNPFGWRFMGALFGVLMLPVLYHLLWQLLGGTFLSTAGTLLFALDFMHFTQTRIATIDTYAVFFILLMYDAMVVFLKRDLQKEPLKKCLPPLLFSGLFMGIGCASKWTVVYGALGLAVLLFTKLAVTFFQCEDQEKKNCYLTKVFRLCLWCCLFFLVIPLDIYFAAFLPYTGMPGKQMLSAFLNYQTSMYRYHANLVAEHAFSSPWYQWPLIIKPVWFYFSGSLPTAGEISTISSFGNPALWWPAIPAMLFTLSAAFRKRAWVPVVASAGFLSVYLPWVLVPRLTFIYHYFTAVPFLVVALVYGLRLLQTHWAPMQKDFSLRLWKSRTVKISRFHCVVSAFLLLNLVLFAAFFPVISGAETTRTYADSLEWFSGWYFA